MTAQELQTEIQEVQPDLLVTARSGGFDIGGIFRVLDNEGILLDEFQIRMAISECPLLFPPQITETGGRLPVDVNRHVNPANGTVCYFTNEDFYLWLAQGNGKVSEFLEGPLRNYFISQLSFQQTGQWPFGERPHGNLGRLDFYLDLFGLKDAALMPHPFYQLWFQKFKGHHPCPCGSKRQIRRCHKGIIMVQKSFPKTLLGEVVPYIKIELAKREFEKQMRLLLSRRRMKNMASETPLALWSTSLIN
jgi:hypothetical protein